MLACDRMRSSVRPQFAAFATAGRNGDLRIGSKPVRRVGQLSAPSWFSRSRSFRSWRPLGSSTSHAPFTSVGLPSSVGLCSSPCRITIILSLHKHGPDRACHAVGQGNCDQDLRFSLQHPGQPRALGYRPASRNCSRVSFLRNFTSPVIVAPWSWKTRFARSIPIIVSFILPSSPFVWR